MICKNCPFGEWTIENIEGNIRYYIKCCITEEEKDCFDECFFPETTMEKGI